MGKVRSNKERKLQRRLIPVNIVVCVLALVAALTLFLTPILKVNVGKILRDEAIIDVIFGDDEGGNGDNNSDGAVALGGDLGDYAPLIKSVVSNVLSEAEGSISISAVSALRVMKSDDKADKVLDELLFGENALVTKLANSLVDGVFAVFDSEDTKQALQETLASALVNSFLEGNESKEQAEAVAKDVGDIVDIFNKLGDDANVPDGKVDQVAEELITKIDGILGDDNKISEEDKKEITKQIQDLYDTTKAELKEGEKVTVESIICVAISKNIDIGSLNIEELLSGLSGDSGTSDVHINLVDEEVTDPDSGEEGEKRQIVTNFKDLLGGMGFDGSKKDELKSSIKTYLNDWVKGMVSDAGIDEFFEYYEFVFYAMLLFIVPWLILFLFSFLHLLAGNKRFTMWYVKLICWIPSVIWLALKLAPVVLSKIAPEMLEGASGGLVKALLGGITSYTWINGLCYVLLWLVSIFWAFPIKRKIRKERRNAKADDGYDEEDEYDEY